MRLIPAPASRVSPAFCFIVLALLALSPGSRAGAADPASSAPDSTALARLGRDVVPTFERVFLRVDPGKPDYAGDVAIQLRVDRPTDRFRFHAEDMGLQSVALSGPRGDVPARWTVGERGTVTLTTDSRLPRGSYSLAIRFSTHFDTETAGLYRVESGGRAYAFTQFEADDARRAFPCWDEPAFKIPFQFVLEVPKGDLAVTNAPLERDSATGDSATTVTFRRTKPIPSYALAVAVGPFDTVPIPGLSVPGRVVFPKGDPRLAGLAVRMTPPLLSALERYFGRPYPYEKLDLIAVPEFWPGGMENPGAITFQEGALLLDPKSASAGSRSRLARYLAHEMAHMWFGDLVTMEWWDDLWLNESFAEWMGDKVADQVFPELRVGTEVLFQREVAFSTDSKLATHAIRRPVDRLDNLLSAADELAYFKGQAVLGMFERWLGPETFRRGVNAYIKGHEWGNARGSDLWDALSKASGKDVAGAMATFLDQPGVPLVSAKALPGGGVELSQERFLAYGIHAPDELWRVPVTLRYSKAGVVRTKSVLLDRPVMDVALDGAGPAGWIDPNADEVGYYRWAVDSGSLDRLVRNASALSVRARMGVVQNGAGLLHAGLLHSDAYLDLLPVFAADPDPQVVDAAVGAIATIRQELVPPELEDAFARYVRATLAAPLRRFSWSLQPGEEEAVSLMRPSLLQCLGDDGGDSRVLGYADSLAARYVADPESVDGSLAGVALHLSALRGDSTLFARYREGFERATEPAERQRYLSSLGWFRDPTLVDRALAYALTGPLKSQEMFTILAGINTSPVYRDRTWRWFEDHYGAFVSRIPAMYVVYVPYLAGGCSTERLEEAKRFFAEPAHVAPGVAGQLAKVAQSVEDCSSLREREGAATAAYLNRVSRAP